MIAGLSGRLAALLSVAAVLVVALVGWLLLVSPQRSKAANLSVQIDSTQAQVESTQAYVSNPATRRSIHELARLKKVLPDDPRMSQILRQLSATAGAARISITGVTPQANIPANGGEALPVALTVEGHYFGIAKFLHILRTKAFVRGTTVRGAGRLYSVDGIQFANGASSSAGSSSSSGSSGTSSGNGTITATVSLNAFVFGARAAAPPTNADTSGGTTTAPSTTTPSSSAAPVPSP